MILTFTPHPSIDLTLSLPEPIRRGAVQRLEGSESVAGGKGINVAQACVKAGKEALAIFPACKKDPFLGLVDAADVPALAVEMPGRVRTNTAVTEPDGTTTKFNGQGPTMNDAQLEHVAEVLKQEAKQANWVVLAGSLPPGAPNDWYASLINAVRSVAPKVKIAVDTSDAALEALGEHFGTATPDLIKPNGVELGQLVGMDGEALEDAAQEGNFAPVIEAAAPLLEQGIQYVLVTLGAAGAVLVSNAGVWRATPPPTVAVSTVGAGDCTLSGFIMGLEDNQPEPEALALGVAYGSAAASLPGTTIPTPEHVNVAETHVMQVHSNQRLNVAQA
ncbi:1-phosphofructokinase family hexose kinase [Corynebacterium kozikiae]|uniref:1-phosphofructokinase family hexose kinase n=1 Tax=Corynebacterium kozikiae TaxID=2968469 RepID=UPI00211D0E05|nr:1-phosphofructokinase family hexose kinase [Corynebacterium sp. 76QC2CO]